MSRSNWFFGFPLDGAFVLELPPLPPAFRRYDPLDVHLTLAFLGGCGEQAALRALTTLDVELRARPRSSLAVSLGEVVPMGPPGRYSALSSLLNHGRYEVEQYLGELGPVLSQAALGKHDGRPRKAHVTLARPARNATAVSRRAGLVWASSVQLAGVSQQLDRIALYTWSHERRDCLFRIAAERPLTAAPI